MCLSIRSSPCKESISRFEQATIQNGLAIFFRGRFYIARKGPLKCLRRSCEWVRKWEYLCNFCGNYKESRIRSNEIWQFGQAHKLYINKVIYFEFGQNMKQDIVRIENKPSRLYKSSYSPWLKLDMSLV